MADDFLPHKSIFQKETGLTKKLFSFVVAVFFCLNALGCAALIVGGAIGAAGGYVISKDTIKGETDKNYDSLWSTALAISRIRGTIKQEDKTRGYIELEAESSKVYIRLIKVTRATTRLKVSARRYHVPNLDLAQDIYTKIMNEAK